MLQTLVRIQHPSLRPSSLTDKSRGVVKPNHQEPKVRLVKSRKSLQKEVDNYNSSFSPQRVDNRLEKIDHKSRQHDLENAERGQSAPAGYRGINQITVKLESSVRIRVAAGTRC